MNFFKRRNKAVCNMCGKKLYKLKLLEIEFQAIYGSKHDGDTIKFRFCADCLDLFIDDYLLRQFAKKPEITDCFEWCKKAPSYYR